MSDKATCATCQSIGRAYWGDHSDFGGRTHFCKKDAERRQDTMKPTGDFAEDFMRNFRTFFDAKANNAACRYYEVRKPIEESKMAILQAMAATDGKAMYTFFSEGNRLCEEMNGLFVEHADTPNTRGKPSDRHWRLTAVGKVEAARNTENVLVLTDDEIVPDPGR